MSTECLDLLKSILKKNPEERPSAKDILDHNWFDLMFDDSSIKNKKSNSLKVDNNKTLIKK
jgi:serine/threonine protein kinase